MVLPLVLSTIVAPGLSNPRRSASDQRHAEPISMLPHGVVGLEPAGDPRPELERTAEPPQLDQWRPADSRRRNVGVNSYRVVLDENLRVLQIDQHAISALDPELVDLVLRHVDRHRVAVRQSSTAT